MSEPGGSPLARDGPRRQRRRRRWRPWAVGAAFVVAGVVGGVIGAATASRGLFVAGVVAGGPVQRAGLRHGDVITGVDGIPAVSNVQLQELTLTRNPGSRVTIDYLRDGHSGSVTVTLAAQP
jgi:S1-C subfamily serine protease